jgi:hypothetical protein
LPSIDPAPVLHDRPAQPPTHISASEDDRGDTAERGVRSEMIDVNGRRGVNELARRYKVSGQ